MIEQVRKYALEKFAGDQQAADDFVTAFGDEILKYEPLLGLSKEAAGPMGPDETSVSAMLGQNVAREATGAIGKALGGLTVGLGMQGLSSLVHSVRHDRLRTSFLEALGRAIASNSVLRGSDKAKVQNYAETIFKFAPHVATDSNLLSSILASAVHGEGIDPMTIRQLSDLESKYSESMTSSMFTPKAFV